MVTPDRPGLLYEMSLQFNKFSCNIEAALIDTEGRTAIDVFYLTCKGGKLPEAQKKQLEKTLVTTLNTRT